MTAERFRAFFRCSEGCDFRAELTEVQDAIAMRFGTSR